MPTRRRPHIATFVALLVTLAFGTQVSLAARSAEPSLVPLQPINVVATDSSSVTISWPQLPERLGVVGYRVYVNGVEKATVEPDRGWRRKDTQQFTMGGLSCGTGYQISVEAFDRADNRSPRASTTVSTNACSDTTPPSAPSAVRQIAATESSVVLAWAPSTDNVGVTEYGLYAAGVGVGSVSAPTATFSNLECDKAYLIGHRRRGRGLEPLYSGHRVLQDRTLPQGEQGPVDSDQCQRHRYDADERFDRLVAVDRRRLGQRLRSLPIGHARLRNPLHEDDVWRSDLRHDVRSRRRRLRRRGESFRGGGSFGSDVALPERSDVVGCGVADDRERVDRVGHGGLARRVRQERRQGRG